MERSWDNSVWFFDLDDTLIRTAEAHGAGVEGMAAYVASLTDAAAGRAFSGGIADLFRLLFAGYKVREPSGWAAVPGGQEAFDALVGRIESAQPEVIRAHGHAKKWSREIWAKLVADDLGIAVTPETVGAAANAYWDALTAANDMVDGARALLGAIRAHGRPVFILTSSDGRLTMNADGTFSYHPEHSLALKARRVEHMRQKGLSYDALSIGDPEDKPGMAFFQKGIAAAEAFLGKPIDPSACIMVGDSYGGDLKTPREQMGFGLAVWFNNGHGETKREDDTYLSTGDLAGLPALFS